MKTPREILLNRHRNAEPKLDAIRHTTVAAVCDCRSMDAERRSQTAATIARRLWCELVLPARRILAGLAAAWVVILSLNFYAADHTTQQVRQAAPPSPELRLALREQRRELARLIEPSMVPVSEQPKSLHPSPRSERRDEMLAA